MSKLPKARLENIVVQDLGGELLIYNLTTHKAYTLNQTSKIVFEACGGGQSFDELKRRHKFTDDLIYLALDELRANNLLEDYRCGHFAGVSRREVIRRVGLATMIALPVVASLVAPKASRAASGVAGENLCAEIECPYAETQCQDDGKCDPATGDCIKRFQPIGYACNDGNFLTSDDICDGAGNCVSCPQGTRDCSGGTDYTSARCIDVLDDPNNCGACGNVCNAGRNCFNGNCIAPID
jgi:hypothetical protein